MTSKNIAQHVAQKYTGDLQSMVGAALGHALNNFMTEVNTMTPEELRQIAIDHASATVDNLERAVGTRRISDDPEIAKVQRQYLTTLDMWRFIKMAVQSTKLVPHIDDEECECGPEYICHRHRSSLK